MVGAKLGHLDHPLTFKLASAGIAFSFSGKRGVLHVHSQLNPVASH